jgi:hypothetical protein
MNELEYYQRVRNLVASASGADHVVVMNLQLCLLDEGSPSEGLGLRGPKPKSKTAPPAKSLLEQSSPTVQGRRGPSAAMVPLGISASRHA